MPRIAVDFSDKRDDLESGVYDAMLNNVQLRTGKNGNQYLNWEFTIFDEKAPNRKVWSITGIAENSMWTTVKALKALGRLPNQDESALELNFDDETGFLVEPAIVDVAVRIKITYRKWDGKDQVQVEILNPLSPALSVKF